MQAAEQDEATRYMGKPPACNVCDTAFSYRLIPSSPDWYMISKNGPFENPSACLDRHIPFANRDPYAYGRRRSAAAVWCGVATKWNRDSYWQWWHVISLSFLSVEVQHYFQFANTSHRWWIRVSVAVSIYPQAQLAIFGRHLTSCLTPNKLHLCPQLTYHVEHVVVLCHLVFYTWWREKALILHIITAWWWSTCRRFGHFIIN